MSDDYLARHSENPDRAYVNLMLRRAVSELRNQNHSFCSCAAGNVFYRGALDGISDLSTTLHYFHASHALYNFLPHANRDRRFAKVLSVLKPINGCCLNPEDTIAKVRHFLWKMFPREVDATFLALAVGEFLAPVERLRRTEQQRLGLQDGSSLAEVVVAAALSSLIFDPNREFSEAQDDRNAEPWSQAYRHLSRAPILPPLRGGLFEVATRGQEDLQRAAANAFGLVNAPGELKEILDAAMANGNPRATVVVNEIKRLANVVTDLREAMNARADSDACSHLPWLFPVETIRERVADLDGFSVMETEYGPRITFKDEEIVHLTCPPSSVPG